MIQSVKHDSFYILIAFTVVETVWTGLVMSPCEHPYSCHMGTFGIWLASVQSKWRCSSLQTYTEKTYTVLMCVELYDVLINNFHVPFSSASICSWVKDVLFLCSFLFSWSLIWVSSESSPLELPDMVFSPPSACGHSAHRKEGTRYCWKWRKWRWTSNLS